jgi:hypothetical protein
MEMTTIVVSRDAWLKFFSYEHVLTEKHSGEATKEAVFEKYSIKHWEKIDLSHDQFKITFTDEKKMTLWILRWI